MGSNDILDKIRDLALKKELPKDLIEYCDLVWEAFHLGKDYWKKVKEETRGIEKER